MIKSMTAFSQGAHTRGSITADVTIRSYNSRHLDMALYCPESCQMFEDNIKKVLTKIHERGRIEIRLSVRDDSQDLDQFDVDMAKAISYYKALELMKQELNLSGDISVENILTAKNVIIPSTREHDSEALWMAVQPAVEEASANLDTMRRAEGENLLSDLKARMDYIEKNLGLIQTEAAKIPEIYKQRLMDRIAVLSSETNALDPVRISQEAAILADKSDVSEEIVRLYSHIKQFRQILDSDVAGGRKLNFLIQEFNREFNTIGSKAGNALLAHQVVDLKSELEKIREQVQNIE